MPKLNQIIAVVNSRKSKAQKALTNLHHICQKDESFTGLTRTYYPTDEEGETHPPESKIVQQNVKNIGIEAQNILSELWDTVLTQDIANTQAKTDIKVNGVTLASDIPVTNLLFMEKQLVDLYTFISKLPILSSDEEWVYDENNSMYRTSPRRADRTEKVLRNHVKAEATENHPAQVEVFNEAKKVGEWETVKFSGAIPLKTKQGMLQKVTNLQEAVKFAREEANNMEIKNEEMANKLLGYVFN